MATCPWSRCSSPLSRAGQPSAPACATSDAASMSRVTSPTSSRPSLSSTRCRMACATSPALCRLAARVRRGVEGCALTWCAVPLFWSQTPWALKPVPNLERTPAENQDAITKHFKAQQSHYGPQTIVNLAEQHGKEGLIVDAYRQGVESMADPNVRCVSHRELPRSSTSLRAALL